MQEPKTCKGEGDEKRVELASSAHSPTHSTWHSLPRRSRGGERRCRRRLVMSSRSRRVMGRMGPFDPRGLRELGTCTTVSVSVDSCTLASLADSYSWCSSFGCPLPKYEVQYK